MDIANIGFRVDTSDLDKARVKLNALTPAAEGVSAASSKVAAAVEGAGASIERAAVASARAKLQEAKTMQSALLATQKATVEEKKLAQARVLNAKAALDQAKQRESEIARINKEAAANRALAGAIKTATSAQQTAAGVGPKLVVDNGPTIARDQMPNRFNTGNIAAQFQDIGVTAAMGMNPMLIAIQQGTQLSAIMNSMEKPLQGIGIALRSVFNAVSLGAIAFVALAAAGLQMVDWTKVAQGSLNLLASGLDFVADNIVVLSAAIGLITTAIIVMNASAISAAIISFASLAVQGVKTAGALLLAWGTALAPLLAYLALIGAIMYGLYKLAGVMDSVFGTSVQKTIDDFSTGLINKVKNGVEQAAAAVRGFSVDLGKPEVDKKSKGGKSEAERYEDIIKGAQRKIETLKAEQQAIGMTEEATAKLKYQTELLNEAQQKNISLTPSQRDKLEQLASTMATIEERTRRMKEAYDFVKDSARGFFQDMKQGLQEGKSLWESFGNAVSNVLNKILDKILDSGINMLFDGMTGGGAGGASSGVLQSIGDYLFAAKGHAFNGSGAMKFAKGGAFTNSIVNRATPFAFANGGAFGVMGEAGPEAVMPLHRGPDGSLGVKASGGKGDGSNVVVNVINNGNSKASVQQRQNGSGMEIDVIIDDIVGQKLSEQGSSSNRSLSSFNNRSLVSR